MTNYDHHFVNNPEGFNESQFDISDAMDDLLDVACNPNADQYEVGEAAGWIVQNYVDLRKERDALREKVKQLEADLRGKNPPIWEGWSL
jgi:hypothetical protein